MTPSQRAIFRKIQWVIFGIGLAYAIYSISPPYLSPYNELADLPCEARTFRPAQTYRYHFAETTGINKFILLDGQEQAIHFAPDSDPEALAALQQMNWSILYRSAEPTCKIVLIGELSEDTCMTPDKPRMATPEKFRVLRLHDWYIVTPFACAKPDGVLRFDDAPYPTETRKHLRLQDFQDPLALRHVDLRRFEKTEAEHQALER